MLRWDPMEVLVVFSRVAVSANATGEIKARLPWWCACGFARCPVHPRTPTAFS